MAVRVIQHLIKTKNMLEFNKYLSQEDLFRQLSMNSQVLCKKNIEYGKFYMYNQILFEEGAKNILSICLLVVQHAERYTINK